MARPTQYQKRLQKIKALRGADALAPLAIPAAGGRRPRLTELDALRGLGAILVVNFHYATRFHEMFPQARHVGFSIFGGNYRVLLFFAISGFAIFFTMNHIKGVADFIVGRFARLFPAYWGAMAITLAVEYAFDIPGLEISPLAALVNLTMLQSYFYVPDVDGAYWTLAVELGFYASMLTLWKLGGLRTLEPLLLAWLGLKWVVFYWPDFPFRLALLLVLKWIPFFAIGILSYRTWAGLRTWSQQAPYLLAILITVACTESPDILVAAVILIATFALMVESRLRWLRFPPLMWVGSISYSLYLVHQNVGFVIMLTGNRLGVNPLVSYGVAIGTAVLLGLLINRFVERPAGTCIVYRWEKRRKAVSLKPGRIVPGL